MSERERPPEAAASPTGAGAPSTAMDGSPAARGHAERNRRYSIRSAFDRAAASYDEAAHVQREVCARLARFASAHGLHTSAPAGAPILDAGCGTGFGLDALAQQLPGVPRIALDLAPSMLGHARRRAAALRAAGGAEAPGAAPLPGGADLLLAVCGDLEHLPLASASVGLIWSSLAMQWCEPARALAECARVLAAGGLALVATLGPRTLWELREAFALIDDARHTIDFQPLAYWIEAARDAGLGVEASLSTEVHAWASDLRGLLQDIKRIGAATVDGGRRRQPLGRAAWSRLQAAYERHRRADDRLPATYEVILLALRKPDPPTS